MTFRLEIRLGNEAMQTPEQVAATLRRVADNYLTLQGFPLSDRPYPICALNGAPVGKWKVTRR